MQKSEEESRGVRGARAAGIPSKEHAMLGRSQHCCGKAARRQCPTTAALGLAVVEASQGRFDAWADAGWSRLLES
eukprot:XP_001691344.1 predicted protein [Chlamydomonas reinhardtii]